MSNPAISTAHSPTIFDRVDAIHKAALAASMRANVARRDSRDPSLAVWGAYYAAQSAISYARQAVKDAENVAQISADESAEGARFREEYRQQARYNATNAERAIIVCDHLLAQNAPPQPLDD